MIVTTLRPSVAEVSSALAAGYAVELNRDGSARFIGQDHEIEIDTLGDRLFTALEHRPPASEWPQEEHSDAGRHRQTHRSASREAVTTSCHPPTSPTPDAQHAADPVRGAASA